MDKKKILELEKKVEAIAESEISLTFLELDQMVSRMWLQGFRKGMETAVESFETMRKLSLVDEKVDGLTIDMT